MTRPSERHLGDAELDALVLSPDSGRSSGQLSDSVLSEAQRHVEACEDCKRRVQMHKHAQGELDRLGPLRPVPEDAKCSQADLDWMQVAAGLLSAVRTKELMNHAAQCDRCGPLLRKAAETIADETTPAEERLLSELASTQQHWQQQLAARLQSSVKPHPMARAHIPWWKGLFLRPRLAFGAAGALAMAVVVGWLGIRSLRAPSAEQLLAQAYTERRTIEVRIASAKYAPMRVERSPGGSSLDKPPALLKAESLIAENLRKYPHDPAWLQAKARADLLDGNYEEAIKSLERALEAEPESPALLIDLGSAYFLRAEAVNRAIDYGNAIEALGKALSKSPDDPVALFNRALICERTFLYTQAVDDWEHYLRIDPNGTWTEEARKRLAELKEKIREHQQSQAEPLLEPSAIARAGANDPVVSSRINNRIEDYLNLATAEWLPTAFPVSANRTNRDLRAALAVISDLAVEKHNDRWLADLLSGKPDSNFESAIAELSAALKANDSGDNVLARRYASAAERGFRAAGNRAGAARAGVEYIFATHDASEGESCIHAAARVGSRLVGLPYPWLKAQFHLEQGTCFWLMGSLGEAQALYETAEHDAERGNYPAIYLRTQDHLSTLSSEAGDFISNAARTQQALARFWSGHYPPMRGYNLYYNVYESSRLNQKAHLQMVAWRDALVLSDSLSDNVLRAMAHSAMADAALAAGFPKVAEEEFARAGQFFAASPQIRSTRIARVEAETRLAAVESDRGRDRDAVTRLNRFLPEVSRLSDAYLSILFYATLGNSESRIGHATEAESALRSAIALAELQLHSLHGDKPRIDWEERTANAYREFAQLRLLQGDPQGALEIWELYRGAAPRAGSSARSVLLTKTLALAEPREVTKRLPALSNATVVTYAVLPRGLAVWVFDNRGVFVHWAETKPAEIEAQAKRFRTLCSDPQSDLSSLQRDARTLYDLLIAPIEEKLKPEKLLVIEADDPLAGLPFEALLDTQGRYLSERGPIISSLGVYYRKDRRTLDPISVDSTVLVAAVPTSSADKALSVTPLPDATHEGELVEHSFHGAQILSAREATVAAVLARLPGAAVFHFAGHAISSRQQAGLLLSDALLTSSSLKTVSLSRLRLAVFSACDTQTGSGRGAADSDSLVRAFLRAGVPEVIASRWKVDSAATRQFMDLLYRALLDGSNAADAIRQAQTGLRSRPGMDHPYYWSAFSAFGLI